MQYILAVQIELQYVNSTSDEIDFNQLSRGIEYYKISHFLKHISVSPYFQVFKTEVCYKIFLFDYVILNNFTTCAIFSTIMFICIFSGWGRSMNKLSSSIISYLIENNRAMIKVMLIDSSDLTLM